MSFRLQGLGFGSWGLTAAGPERAAAFGVRVMFSGCMGTGVRRCSVWFSET